MPGNNPRCCVIYPYGHSLIEILSASTNTFLETILEAHLKLQGWIIMASFENMEAHMKDEVTNDRSQSQGKNLFKMSILIAQHLFGCNTSLELLGAKAARQAVSVTHVFDCFVGLGPCRIRMRNAKGTMALRARRGGFGVLLIILHSAG